MPRTFAPDVLSHRDALARLREGNQRFVRGDGIAVRAWHPELANGQTPVATVLCCSDSRSPAEYVFDQGLGDLFVIRVAGNIIVPSLVGSVEFASSQFGTRLVVVMGHTKCGAIRATLQALEAEGLAESKNQQSIVDRIKPHIAEFAKPGGDPDERYAAAVKANVIASTRGLRNSSPLLDDLVERGHIAIVGAVYDLTTGVVNFLE